MLYHTFCHIPGIGIKTEKKLWQAGVHTWESWPPPHMALPNTIAKEIPSLLERSITALELPHPQFFTQRLASGEHWRIFPHFRNKTAFLDIETTGEIHTSEITTISLYNGQDIYTYVNGINLNDFAHDIFKYSTLVTYNGKCFDIPIIEKYFDIKLEQAHIDLRYVLANLGIKGGLKGCEKQLGLNRGILDGVDGSFAIYLWQEYEKYNNQKALETLLAYNIEDTVNLEKLLVEAYNKNVFNSPFYESLSLDYPGQPSIPFQADSELIESIKRRYGGLYHSYSSPIR